MFSGLLLVGHMTVLSIWRIYSFGWLLNWKGYKGTGRGQIKVLFQNLVEETGINHEDLGMTDIYSPRFEPRIWRIPSFMEGDILTVNNRMKHR
jgi:hypothetical protein